MQCGKGWQKLMPKGAKRAGQAQAFPGILERLLLNFASHATVGRDIVLHDALTLWRVGGTCMGSVCRGALQRIVLMVLSLVTQEIAQDTTLSPLELRLLIYLGGEDGLTPSGYDGYSRFPAGFLARLLHTGTREIIRARTRLVTCGYIERRLAEFRSGGHVQRHYCYRIALEHIAYG